MNSTSAQEKLTKKVNDNLHICVGLDSDKRKIPNHLLSTDDPVFEFNKQIIEQTSDKAAAYKLNLAFYESEGIKGLHTLEKTLQIIPQDILTIGDAKRGDIGNTSEKYAQSLFNYYKFDASTLHPYMGSDSVEPFLNFKEKLNFILVLTSNPSSSEFEKQKLANGKLLYQEILDMVQKWNTNKNCGIVFGATQSQELRDNIKSIGDLPVLLPGVGAQGGSLEDVIKIFESAGSNNYLVNVSRAIIFADKSKDFAEAASAKLDSLNEHIAEIKNLIN